MNTNCPSVSYQIEKIIDAIAVQGDITNFKVQWAPTWVSSLNLVGCEKLMKEFLSERSQLTTSISNESPGNFDGSPGNFDGSPGNLIDSPGILNDSPGNLNDSPGNLNDSPGNFMIVNNDGSCEVEVDPPEDIVELKVESNPLYEDGYYNVLQMSSGDIEVSHSEEQIDILEGMKLEEVEECSSYKDTEDGLPQITTNRNSEKETEPGESTSIFRNVRNAFQASMAAHEAFVEIESLESIYSPVCNVKSKVTQANDKYSSTRFAQSIDMKKLIIEGMYKCNACGMAFVNPNYFSEHQCFFCSYCQQNFYDETVFDKHKSLHESNEQHDGNEMPVVNITEDKDVRKMFCAYCKKVFTNKNLLAKHVLLHSGNKSKSTKKIRHKKGVLEQKRAPESNDKAKPANNFPCELCHETFYGKHQLGKHRVVHSNQKNFKCKVCAKHFRRFKSLILHMKTHKEQTVSVISDSDGISLVLDRANENTFADADKMLFKSGVGCDATNGNSKCEYCGLVGTQDSFYAKSKRFCKKECSKKYSTLFQKKGPGTRNGPLVLTRFSVGGKMKAWQGH